MTSRSPMPAGSAAGVRGSSRPTFARNARPTLAGVPLDRMGSAGDVADAVLYLASPMGAYVTGAVLTVDGGLAM